MLTAHVVDDGASSSSPRLASLSGSSTPDDITVSGSDIYITWHTDGSVSSGRGFQASVTCVGAGTCSGQMQIPSDGNIGFDSYSNNQDCQWGGHCASGHPFIHFTSFDTEHNFDYVRVCELQSLHEPCYLFKVKLSICGLI